MGAPLMRDTESEFPLNFSKRCGKHWAAESMLMNFISTNFFWRTVGARESGNSRQLATPSRPQQSLITRRVSPDFEVLQNKQLFADRCKKDGLIGATSLAVFIDGQPDAKLELPSTDLFSKPTDQNAVRVQCRGSMRQGKAVILMDKQTKD